MGKSRLNYLMRQFVQFLIGFFLLVVAVFFTINVYSYQYYLMRHFVIPTECPDKISKLDALNDYSTSDSGLMHCYCYNEIFEKGNTGMMTNNFADVAHNGQKEKKYCGAWVWNGTKMKAMLIVASTLVFVIYFVAAMIFECLGAFSKFKTMNQ